MCDRGNFMRTMYVLCAWATYCVHIVLLLRVSDLCARSDLCVRSTTATRERLIEYLIVRLLRVATSSSSSHRPFCAIWDRAMTCWFAVCDHASDLIFWWNSGRWSSERTDWLVRKVGPSERSDWLVRKVGPSERSDWLVRKVSPSERSDWLVRKVGPYERSDWLVQKVGPSEQSDWLVRKVGQYITLWLAGTEVGPYRTLWLAGTEVGPYRTLWLDGFASRSWTERSDWRFQISVFGRLRWTSCFANSDISLRTTRKSYAKCVLFCVKVAIQPAVARKTNKRPSLFNITYSTRGEVTLLCTMLNDGAR